LPITGGIGRTTVNSEGKHDYQGKTLSPGMIKELNAGDEVQVVNPSGQSSDAESYTKLQQRLIGADCIHKFIDISDSSDNRCNL